VTTHEIPLATRKREDIRRQIVDLAAMARAGSIEAHARLLHRADDGKRILAMRHHREWCRILEARERFPYVVIVAPPGTAKTTWVSQVYASHAIGIKGGDVRIGLISNTATQAEALGAVVQQIVEKPAFDEVYDVRPDLSRAWRSNWFFTTGRQTDDPNPTLHATGIGGPVQGRRYDEIILDDPTDWDDARSDTIMGRQRDWLRNTLIQRFPLGQRPPDGKGTRMVVILTRWSARDLVPTLKDLGFVVVHMPALGYWDRIVSCPECGEERDPSLEASLGPCEKCGTETEPTVTIGDEPLWAEKESREALETERENDQIMFELVKQGNPSVLSGDYFDPDNFQRGPLPGGDKFTKVVQFVDTAGGKDMRKGDYFCMATVGTVASGEGWIIDIDRGRYDAPTQERRVVRNYETWTDWRGKKIDLVCVEMKNEGIALYQNLIVSSRLPMKDVEVTADKTWRAIPLANAYRARKMWHPESAKWRKPYEAELEAFDNGAHDDQVDAAGGAWAELGSAGPRVRTLAPEG
jgi:predicted phage terminase large subunit-like protein